MRKKKSPSKMPYHGDKRIAIYGIFHLPSQKLIKVDLNEEDIWFEYEMSMYDENEYAVIKLFISL